MKIKDIISEQGVWSGVKNVGKGLGQIAGGVGMGALRALDKIGGGTGEVGTASQIASYKAAQKAKQSAQVSKRLPAEALAAFQAELEKMGINLNDARTFNPEQVEKMLEQFALQFFTSDQTESIANYIYHQSTSVPMPTVINSKSAMEYFNRMAQIKKDAQGILQQTGKSTTPLHTVAAGPARGISLIHDYPAIIKYNNTNYSLSDDGFWEDDNGVRPKKQWQLFLYKQADLLIPGSAELNKAFDTYTKQTDASGAATQQTTPQATPTAQPAQTAQQGEKLRDPNATPLYTVVTNSGERVTKYSDGLWIDDNDEYISDPIDIEKLEKEAEAMKYTKQASIPKSKMPAQTWKTQKADEREAARQKRMGQLGAEDEAV